MLNSPCLGSIPTVKLDRKAGCPLVLNFRRTSGFSESIRLLRLHVEKVAEEDKKVLLISSAIPGEGKITVSENLPASLAKEGKRFC